MQIDPAPLSGVLILRPARHGDARGFFSESWNRRTRSQAGVDLPEFVQDNHSMSVQAGTLRGDALSGAAACAGQAGALQAGIAVRRGGGCAARQPDLRQRFGAELSLENGRRLWIPAGFLHGFATSERDTEIVYKCTDHYDKVSDGRRRDSLSIDWGVTDPLLSDKDRAAPALGDGTPPFIHEALA